MRAYGVPIGLNYLEATAQGLEARLNSPEKMASALVVVNSVRLSRALKSRLGENNILLPRIETVDSLLANALPWENSQASSEIAQVLSIAQLLDALRQKEPDAFLGANRFEIAFALEALLQEFAERNLDPACLRALDLGEFAAHWQINAQFFGVLADYWQQAKSEHHFAVIQKKIDALRALWQAAPHLGEVFVIGTTGSRPVMRHFLEVVADLPSANLVLPAYDFSAQDDLPQDHPQFGAKDMLDFLNIENVEIWGQGQTRIGRLLHYAFAPAPQTDGWLDNIEEIGEVARHAEVEISYLAAEDINDEAAALAVALYEAVQSGHRPALVSADRNLVRRILPRLESLGLSYNDSAGTPMQQSPAAIFASQLLDLVAEPNNARLLAFLSHPYVSSDETLTRKHHLRLVRKLDEEVMRNCRYGRLWQAARRELGEEAKDWCDHWQAFLQFDVTNSQPLKDWMEWHLESLAQASGFARNALGEIGGKGFGDAALFAHMEALSAGADSQLSFAEYCQFWQAWLARQPAISKNNAALADVQILGQIEARTHNADFVILAGMNEGFWPSVEMQDMWLNRKLRTEIGLEIPERFIGLTAQDFLNGFTAPKLLISRALSQGGTPTIESRFVTRLRVLIGGAAPDAWENVKSRGAHFLAQGRALMLPLESERQQPNPRPKIYIPKEARPLNISATGLDGLFRNPYRFYAERTLGLRDLGVRVEEMSAAEKGEIAHKLFQRLSEEIPPPTIICKSDLDERLEQLLNEVELDDLNAFEVRLMFARLWPLFEAEENARREVAVSIRAESQMEAVHNGALPITFRARIDRLDVLKSGAVSLYDYKSGAAPYNSMTTSVAKTRQLPIAAWIIAQNGFEKIENISALLYKDSGRANSPIQSTIAPFDLEVFSSELDVFCEDYLSDDFGFFAAGSGSDHYGEKYRRLARFGEWLDDDYPVVVRIEHE